MKKFLLFAAAALTVSGAFAAEKVLAETDFATADGYYFWKSDVTNAEIKDGGLTITNDAAAANFWDIQYMVADNMQVSAETEYTVSVKIKGFSGPLHYVLGSWGTDVFAGAAQVEENADWQTVSFSGKSTAAVDGGVHLLLQSGEFVGSYTIANVKITYNEAGGEPPVEPVEPGSEKVLATMYPGTSSLIGWGGSSSREVVTEDGREALKLTNPEKCANPWDAQFAFDYSYEAGTTYFFSFDVKGDAGTITSGFQQTNGYIGCGNFDNFSITPEWNTVTIKGTAGTSDNGDPDRWVANLGDYAGTFYISNMKLYVMDINAVETIAPVKVNSAVYNLQGVKVANSLEEVAAPGLYISNGKKVVRK